MSYLIKKIETVVSIHSDNSIGDQLNTILCLGHECYDNIDINENGKVILTCLLSYVPLLDQWDCWWDCSYFTMEPWQWWHQSFSNFSRSHPWQQEFYFLQREHLIAAPMISLPTSTTLPQEGHTKMLALISMGFQRFDNCQLTGNSMTFLSQLSVIGSSAYHCLQIVTRFNPTTIQHNECTNPFLQNAISLKIHGSTIQIVHIIFIPI